MKSDLQDTCVTELPAPTFTADLFTVAQRMEATEMSFSGEGIKIVWSSHTMKYVSFKKGNVAICDSMDDLGTLV